MQTFGSRAEVFHGTAMKTTGGLTKSDLTQDKYGAIISKAARKAALARMKAEGKQHLVKVFKPKKERVWSSTKGRYEKIQNISQENVVIL